MRMSARRSLAIVTCTALPLVFLAAAPALAAAPSNDNRANAQVVHLQDRVTGMTVDATVESGEDQFVCDGQSTGSVWYRFSARGAFGVVAKLAAHGNLDAEIDVYKQRRSQLDFAACDLTDDQGLGAAAFRVTEGSTYFIRVAERPHSEHNSFSLKLVQGPPPAAPPGKSLTDGHARGRLDRVLRVDAAYHLHLKAGTPYRFNLVHSESICQSLQLYAPGTTNFSSATPVMSRRCGGYALYVPSPGTGGRYYLRVRADRTDREVQPYLLLAGRAGRDDVAPGLVLPNHAHHKARVNGGRLDVQDVYRVNVAFHSQLDLRLVGAPGHNLVLDLRNGRGHQLRCGCDPGPRQSISLRVKPGRYLVAVRAADHRRSRYELSRKTRTITATTATVDGFSRIHALPRRAVTLGASVRPGASGETVLDIQHFDPFAGWLPYRHHRISVVNGQGTYTWTPPSVGRWRIRADYLGTRNFAPSQSGYAHVLVAKALNR